MDTGTVPHVDREGRRILPGPTLPMAQVGVNIQMGPVLVFQYHQLSPVPSLPGVLTVAF